MYYKQLEGFLRDKTAEYSAEMQEIIGGYIEPIRLNDGRMIIVDEDGKSKDKAVNIPATNILRRDHYTTDYIVGTAIVCDADMVD